MLATESSYLNSAIDNAVLTKEEDRKTADLTLLLNKSRLINQTELETINNFHYHSLRIIIQTEQHELECFLSIIMASHSTTFNVIETK